MTKKNTINKQNYTNIYVMFWLKTYMYLRDIYFNMYEYLFFYGYVLWTCTKIYTLHLNLPPSPSMLPLLQKIKPTEEVFLATQPLSIPFCSLHLSPSPLSNLPTGN